MRDFLKADKPDDLDEELYQRVRFYANYLFEATIAGRSFLITQTHEFASYVYKHRICGDDDEFKLQKAKQALDYLGYESNNIEYALLLAKYIKNQKNRLKKKKQ